MEDVEKIGFGGSCHWCTEAVFQSIRGVVGVEQGWISPSGSSQFSEAVLVNFDPHSIDLSVLVAIHLHSHSSTSSHSMRQKYRSAVYVFSERQGDHVMKAIMGLKHEFDGELITQILSFGSFKLNSEEFLDYYATDPRRPFCKNYIEPKLKLLLERFGKSVVKSAVKKEINH
ncbi:MAG: peptide methionine sulfoxide reductase [Chryseobacterium sp.]|nr:MAG: peptide methionine sulfoxide reductase [Chryseobacterium sp.]